MMYTYFRQWAGVPADWRSSKTTFDSTDRVCGPTIWGDLKIGMFLHQVSVLVYIYKY